MRTLFALLLLLMAEPLAAANLIASYSETNKDTEADLDASLPAIGQTFTSDGSTLDSSKFYCKKVGSPTGNCFSKLYALTGTPGTNAVPTGAALATSDPVDITTVSGVFVLVTFTFSGANRYVMTNTVNYGITVEFSGTHTGADNLGVGYDTSSPTDPGNLIINNGSWVSVAGGTDATCFYVYGVTGVAAATRQKSKFFLFTQ